MRNIAFKLAGKTLSIISGEDMTKTTGEIFINSDPLETEVYINNTLQGKTPLIIKNIEFGEKVLVFKKTGYLNLENQVSIASNKITNIDVKLVQQAQLNIRSDPEGASVYIDNEIKGRTPIDLRMNPNRNIKIKLSDNKYGVWEKTIYLKEGVNETIQAKLEQLTGTLKFEKYPNGASLTLNQKNYSLNKDIINLPVGTYALNITCPGYYSRNYNVEVESE